MGPMLAIEVIAPKNFLLSAKIKPIRGKVTQSTSRFVNTGNHSPNPIKYTIQAILPAAFSVADGAERPFVLPVFITCFS